MSLLGESGGVERPQRVAAGRAERRQRQRRRQRGLLVVLSLALVAGLVGVAFSRGDGKEPRRVPAGARVTVSIQPGEGSRSIAAQLERLGVVEDALAFRKAAEERGVDGALKPGQYQLVTGMDTDALLDVLTKGPDQGLPVTVPEGYTVREIASLLVTKGGFSAAEVNKALAAPGLTSPYRPAGRPLEGLLFPATYRVKPGTSAETVLSDMLGRLEQVLAGYDLRAAPLRLSPYQVLIVASLIEREARVGVDRPKIATVIYNRLARNWALQIDATVQYAILSRTGRYKPRLAGPDLAIASPYNTYRNKGLPPTPIAAPGAASIEAALRPARGNWLFYVLYHKDGRHAFTHDHAEFDRLVADARRRGVF